VAKGKDKSGRLSVFKGREARLNRAIFHILALKSPYAFNALLREVRKQRGLQDTRDSVLRRRVEALEKQDFLMKVGTTKARLGYDTPLYGLTPRAELSIVINETDLDRFVKQANYDRIIRMLYILKSSS
jgi:hypothetical protein